MNEVTSSNAATTAVPTPVDDNQARSIVDDIARRFERGWNAGDGPAYVEPLAIDADYITIQGVHGKGRDFLGEGIAELYATIYRGSELAIELTDLRIPAPGVILAQLRHDLDAPAGPLAGGTTTLATVVVIDNGSRWEVVALHNTVVTAT